MIRRRAPGAILALALVAALGAGLLVWAPFPLRAWQDRVFDAVLRVAPAALPVVVVEIGALDDAGAPWSRAASAQLAAVLADAQPRLVAWDIVFAGGCAGPDTVALARAFARVPTTLGLLMRGAALPAQGPGGGWAVAADAVPALWAAPGAEGPCAELLGAGTTLAALSLPADATARVRAVPAAVVAGGRVWPGLPAEVWRRATLAPLGLIAPGTLRLGDQARALAPDGTLRFRPSGPRVWAARSLGAAAVLADPGAVAARLRGAVVLVGVVVPQAGGLRPTAASPLHPSVQIAADAVQTLASARVPHRPGWAPWVEGGGLAVLAAVAALALARLGALAALGAVLGLVGLWAGGAVGALALTDRLIDPAGPALALALAAALALSLQAAISQRAERALRRRMGQVMPPAIVASLAADPGLLRVRGEARVVTALFTDLQGFSDMVNTQPPEAVIARLEAYFPVVVGAVLAEGGMVDKIVGDGVHALFNAPLDQADHAQAALRAARAILARTEALRATPEGAGLGPTRIGIETGRAVLGDVGAGERIDYTAHGPAVNLAARLQEAARDLGVSVAVGPGAAEALGGAGLRPLGAQPVRSFGTLSLFTLDADAPAR